MAFAFAQPFITPSVCCKELCFRSSDCGKQQHPPRLLCSVLVRRTVVSFHLLRISRSHLLDFSLYVCSSFVKYAMDCDPTASKRTERSAYSRHQVESRIFLSSFWTTSMLDGNLCLVNICIYVREFHWVDQCSGKSILKSATICYYEFIFLNDPKTPSLSPQMA